MNLRVPIAARCTHFKVELATRARRGAMAVTAGVLLASFQSALSAQSDRQDDALSERLAALEARIAQLERPSPCPLLDQDRAEQLRSLIQQVLADADTRMSLVSNGATAGYDKGFFIEAVDQTFRLQLDLTLQVRYVFNHQNDAPDGNDDRSGFDVRRSNLRLSGFIGSPDLRYVVSVQKSGEAFAILDSYVDYALAEDMDVVLGRFRPEFLKEQAVSSSRQLFNERSLVARALGEHRQPGVGFSYSPSAIRFAVAVSSDYDAAPNQPDWAIASRAEWLLTGDWKDLKDLAGWPGDDPTMALGFGV